MILDEQQLIKNFLSDYFFRAQNLNPRFSLRSFAQKLDISNSSLSEILRSKRKVSKAKALHFAEVMKLSKQQIKTISDAFEQSGSLEKLKPMANTLKEIVLTPDKFHIMADRCYFCVLALLRSPINSPEGIAKKLGLKESEVKKILEDLAEIKVLVKKNGSFVETERAVFRTSEDFPDNLMRTRRLQNLEAGAEAIKTKAKGERGYFATVSVDKSKLDEIGPIVEDFIKRLGLFLRKPNSEDVFEVNIDIFPWTKN